VTIDGVLEADYDYDLNGNRLQKWTPGGTETGSYDDQDRMATYGNATYTYTRNGELLTETTPAGTTTYGYDLFGNLLGVDLPDGTQIHYVVDSSNRRIGRRENGAWTQKLLWQGQLSPSAELDAANAVVSRFVYATRANIPDYMIRSSQSYRILHDHLGSPRLVVDRTTGAIVQRIDFDEWGVVLANTNPQWIPFGFGGGLQVFEDRSVRLGFRDLITGSGRASSIDPIGHQSGSTNLFAWVSGDPVNRLDSLGLAQKCHRPLAGRSGAILDALYPGKGSSPRADSYNREPLHEHFWFDDGRNVGFFDDGPRADRGHDRSDYVCDGRLLDDATLDKAIAYNSKDPAPYELLGPGQHNCQDWASEVMMEYERLRSIVARETGVDPESEFVWNQLLNRL
jgi:YD repeat-containing protein